MESWWSFVDEHYVLALVLLLALAFAVAAILAAVVDWFVGLAERDERDERDVSIALAYRVRRSQEARDAQGRPVRLMTDTEPVEASLLAEERRVIRQSAPRR